MEVFMNKTRSLWVIAALMSSILQAHAGRPSSPAPTPTPTPQPQQQPAPANTPDTNPSNPPPANAPQGSDTTPTTDNTNTQQSNFLSTTGRQAAATVGALGAAGLLAIGGVKVGQYAINQNRKKQARKEVPEVESLETPSIETEAVAFHLDSQNFHTTKDALLGSLDTLQPNQELQKNEKFSEAKSGLSTALKSANHTEYNRVIHEHLETILELGHFNNPHEKQHFEKLNQHYSALQKLKKTLRGSTH
jgi:hypothetical protein